MSAMKTRLALSATALSGMAALLTLAGLAVLLVAALVEMATGQPGLNLVDAYWVGRLPWTPIGVGMVIFGASAALLLGTMAAWLGTGRAARVLSVPALLAGAFWWGVGSIGAYTGACCGRPAWDPITTAYSSPAGAVVFLVVPALVLAVALRPRRQVVELAGPGADQYRTVSGA